MYDVMKSSSRIASCNIVLCWRVIMMNVCALPGLGSSCLWLTPLCGGGDVSRPPASGLRVDMYTAGVWQSESRRPYGSVICTGNGKCVNFV